MNNNEFGKETEKAISGDEAGKRASSDNRKLKRTILIVFACMAVFAVLFYTLPALIDFESLLDHNNKNSYNPTKQTIIFVTPNYDEDIYKDEVYVGLDRNIYIYDIDTGMTESLEEDDFENYNDGVRLLAEFVNTIIAGNAKKYNDFFSDDCYYNCDIEYKESFTMQKLYNIKITKLSTEEVTEGNSTYTKYNFILEYMIRHNNGTFRTDVGSDATKIQYITVSDREGRLLIDDYRVR